MNEYVCIAPSVKLGRDVKLSKFINLYGCEIGDETKIGAFVEIQKNARVGRCCKISSHSFICEGVDIEDDVFIVEQFQDGGFLCGIKLEPPARHIIEKAFQQQVVAGALIAWNQIVQCG